MRRLWDRLLDSALFWNTETLTGLRKHRLTGEIDDSNFSVCEPRPPRRP